MLILLCIIIYIIMAQGGPLFGVIEEIGETNPPSMRNFRGYLHIDVLLEATPHF